MNELIKLTQLPIIEEHLRDIKESVAAKTAEAASLVCTAETLQAVKSYRADLRKQFDELEAQRKEIKAAIAAPYTQFEAVFKDCVSNAFSAADAALKKKIDEVESEIKRSCENTLREYFLEYTQSLNIDFVDYDSLGITVDMASAKQKTPKKLLEAITLKLDAINADLNAISGMEDAAAILFEYKKSLNLSGAIAIVSERKKGMEAAKRAVIERKAEVEAECEAAAAPAPESEAFTAPKAVEEATEKLYTARFAVTATKDKLILLKQFLTANGIEYTNI